MKSKKVFESLGFKRGVDPKYAMGLGLGKHKDTKAVKVLEYIGEAGEEGKTFTEIQYFIWTEIRGKSPAEFWEKEKNPYYSMGQRKSRGTWTSSFYNYEGSRWDKPPAIKRGLLSYYCEKTPEGKWGQKQLPRANSNIHWNDHDS
ncbi:MAG: hypothetical protein HC831_11800 [Chloroflexia bacterium]|nr:hypothetical protein [Chloroflexia bacterium]